MFDFLGSKKDQEKQRELEENIAEIRKKVQQEEQRQRAPGSQPREPEQSEPPAPPGNGPEQPQRPQTADAPEPVPSRQGDAGGDRQQGDADAAMEEALNEIRKEQEPAPEQREPAPQSPAAGDEQDAWSQQTADTGANTGARLSRDEVPTPPQVKDLDIPDIQKGPLFITMNKFKDALTTLSEMKEFSDELETQIGSLENTLEEDHGTENELRELLDQTIEGVEVIQNIMLPEHQE